MQRLWVCLAVCVLSPGSEVRAEGEVALVRPADNGAALVNPSMGWVFHFYDNIPAHYGSKLAPSDTLDGWPGLFVIYPASDNALLALRKPGTVKLGCTFNVPGDAKGRDFTVYVGLWSPTRQGARNHEERLLPDTGEAERRVLVGRLHVNASGQPTLDVAQ